MKTLQLLILIYIFINITIASDKTVYNLKVRYIKEYEVQKNDTLMLIAFKIYGDYRRWTDLVKINPGLKQNKYNLHKVSKIKFEVPKSLFKWEPLGEPYLIKKNDTLGVISSKVYLTSKRWNEIYQNNRPLIRKPDLIFAGFTLYYIPDPTYDSFVHHSEY